MSAGAVMPAVAFHFNVPERRGYVCRLLRKAWRSGARVVVTGEAAMLAEVDRLLWTFEPLEFVPHWRGGTAPAACCCPPRAGSRRCATMRRASARTCSPAAARARST